MQNIFKLSVLMILLPFAMLIAENAPILVTGNIYDQLSGKPVSTDIKFIDESGNVSRLKSNSIDGFYQQVLPSGKNFIVVFADYIPSNRENTIKIAPYDKYSELKIDYNLVKIDAGLEIFHIDAFVPNSPKFNDQNKPRFDELKELIKTQKMIFYFDITISTEDSHFKPTKEKVTVLVKGKNKTKTVTIKEQELAKRLIEQRKNAILDLMKELKINSRNITFTENPVVIKKSKRANKKKSNSTVTSSNYNTLAIKINRVGKL